MEIEDEGIKRMNELKGKILIILYFNCFLLNNKVGFDSNCYLNRNKTIYFFLFYRN
jgi:hypothetical protein